MLGNSVFLENSGGGAGGVSTSDGVAAELGSDGTGGVGGVWSEHSDRNSAGNRWPREETMSLLRIRSDMDIAITDSSVKAPLWDEVSRKLGELGYHRSAKKCKEKFENIYKYHKRTKEGKSSQQTGKSYRYFEQMELFDPQFSVTSTPLNQIPSYAMETTPSTTVMAKPASSSGQEFIMPCINQDHCHEFKSDSTSSESSSGKESEGSIKKKRKLVHYFERLMKDVLDKQEELQNKFLEAIEKCEKDQIAREEAWKVQEMARIKRELEFLSQERAMAAAKDVAVLAFLQNLTQQTVPMQIPDILTTLFDKSTEKLGNVLKKHCDLHEHVAGKSSTRTDRRDNSAGESAVLMSSSRWPKTEIEALIMLKTDFDMKYHVNGPKGPLWEEISSCMKKHGYVRNAKRCKEKWENINKYYKRVKESNRKRPDDSKTCLYFNLLDSLHAKKFKNTERASENGDCNMKPEQILMQMIGQQQHQQPQQMQPSSGEYDDESDPRVQQDDGEDGYSGDGYQIVGNNLSSVTTLE